jgi:hypothetical protein
VYFKVMSEDKKAGRKEKKNMEGKDGWKEE